MYQRLVSAFLGLSLLMTVPARAAEPQAAGASTPPAAGAASTPGNPASTPGPSDPSTSPQALKSFNQFTGRNGLGVMLGLGSGIGLSYRRYLADSFALRGAGYVFYLGGGAVSYFNLGLAAQYDIRRDPRFVLYALGGLAMGHADPFFTDNGEIGTALFPNLGVGLELGPHDRPALTYQIEIVLTALLVDGGFRLLPLPQAGIHYVF